MMGHLAYQSAIEHVNTLRVAADGRRAGRTVHRDRQPRRSNVRSWLRHLDAPKLRAG
jgi:hypothetical protein